MTPHFFYLFGKSRSLPFYEASLKKICAWELLGANVLKGKVTRANDNSKNFKNSDEEINSIDFMQTIFLSFFHGR